MFNLAGASSPRIWEGGRTLWSTSWSWVFTTFLTLHKNKMQPFNLRGFWLHIFLDHYIYEATLYEIVEGRWSPRSLCLCELFRETGASIPDSDWTANMTNSGSEPTTKRQRFQFGIDELKRLVLIILLPNLVRFLSKASPGDFVNGPFGCSWFRSKNMVKKQNSLTSLEEKSSNEGSCQQNFGRVCHL